MVSTLSKINLKNYVKSLCHSIIKIYSGNPKINKQQLVVIVQTIVQVLFQRFFVIEICFLSDKETNKLKKSIIMDLYKGDFEYKIQDNGINKVVTRRTKEFFIGKLQDLYKKKVLNKSQFDIAVKYTNYEFTYTPYDCKNSIETEEDNSCILNNVKKEIISYLDIKEVINNKKLFEIEFRIIV